MIGHRVRLVTVDPTDWLGIEGILHKIEPSGVTLYRQSDRIPSQSPGIVFIPMPRVREIVDLGRAP